MNLEEGFKQEVKKEQANASLEENLMQKLPVKEIKDSIWAGEYYWLLRGLQDKQPRKVILPKVNGMISIQALTQVMEKLFRLRRVFPKYLFM